MIDRGSIPLLCCVRQFLHFTLETLDSIYFNHQNVGMKVKSPRSGRWTKEEEAYANRLIVEFEKGRLPLTDGTMLRMFLSKSNFNIRR
jgi:hypothetical protein